MGCDTKVWLQQSCTPQRIMRHAPQSKAGAIKLPSEILGDSDLLEEDAWVLKT